MYHLKHKDTADMITFIFKTLAISSIFLVKRKWSYCEVMKNEVTSDIYKWWKNTLWWNFLYHIFENDIDWSKCYQGIKIQFPFTPKTENIEKTLSSPWVF